MLGCCCCVVLSLLSGRQVSALMPSGAYLLTQMQAVGCGFGFGMMVFFRWLGIRLNLLQHSSSTRQKSVTEAEPSSPAITTVYGSNPTRERPQHAQHSKPDRRPTHMLAYVFIASCLCLQNFLNRTGSRGDLVRGVHVPCPAPALINAVQVPGPMMMLLSQAVVPVTMVASMVFLKKRCATSSPVRWCRDGGAL